MTVRITGLLLAAGTGSRFGGGKLEAPFRGEMLGLHAARTLLAIIPDCVAVCPPSGPLSAALADLGFTVVFNNDPARGQSLSLALGLQALGHADGALVALADMPNITPPHIATLIAAFDGNQPVASVTADRRAPPAILPRRLWPELIAQRGDLGARKVLASAVPVSCAPDLLVDIDTVEDLLAHAERF